VSYDLVPTIARTGIKIVFCSVFKERRWLVRVGDADSSQMLCWTSAEAGDRVLRVP
jgi:hypothetical protein